MAMGLVSSPGEMALNHVFLHIYKVFWSFLYDFDLLNPNPLSVSRKSLSNFVQTQKNKMASKTREAIQIAVSAHVFGPHG